MTDITDKLNPRQQDATKVACPFCPDGIAGTRVCPRSGDICKWCCPSCAGKKCASGVDHTRWCAAVRVALGLTLESDDTIDAAMERWTEAYRVQARHEPEPPMCEAARDVLTQRLLSVPPPPASTSSVAWRQLPEVIVGVPKRGGVQ